MPFASRMPCRAHGGAGPLVLAAVLASTAPAWAQDGLGSGGADATFPVEPALSPPGEAADGDIGFGLTSDIGSARVAAARLTVGVGLGASPEYFGSDDYSFGVTGTGRIDYLRLPGGIEFGSLAAPGLVRGFGPRGSVRYIPRRDSSDNSDLRGLDDVDATLEIGLGLGYDTEFARAFGDARYGFGGSDSWAGEFGADALLYPADNVIVNFGPRANWGTENFMDTYFGVSASEADDSGLDEYDPSGGFYSVGVELGARYQFSPAWGLEGRATYGYLVGDAADSPITEVGSRNEFGGRILITRSISLGF
jgi:MipA family protein